MRRLILIAALLLGGCQTVSLATETFDAGTAQRVVYSLKAAYGAALVVAVQYVERPRCDSPSAPILCSDQAAVSQIRKADSVAISSLDAAENAVRSLSANPTVIAGAIAAAKAGVSSFTAVSAAYGKKGQP